MREMGDLATAGRHHPSQSVEGMHQEQRSQHGGCEAHGEDRPVLDRPVGPLGSKISSAATDAAHNEPARMADLPADL